MDLPLPRTLAAWRSSRDWALFAAMRLSIGAVLLTFTAAAVGQQIQVQAAAPQSQEAGDGDPYSVYLPTDRLLSRGMSRAEERLDEHEYNEALAFLQQVLDKEEDTFLDDGDDSDSRRGLKATARRLIANLPPAGRETYELLHATAARRQLEAALATGDREKLAALVRRYLYTPAGYEAALVFAQQEFDRGHPLAAAYIYQHLAEDRRAADQFEPQLSLLAAVSWSAAGNSERAAQTLRELSERRSGGTVELAGRSVRLPGENESDADIAAWLTRTVGLPSPRSAHLQDWLTSRGSPQRNAEFPGGAPHLSPRWQARVVNDPRYESHLVNRREQFEQNGFVALPAARPIAVGDVVLMRTPQNLVAIDWESGKRLWETREDEPGNRDRFLSDVNVGDSQEEWSLSGHPLEQQVWDDTLSMSISSDGERVYAIDNDQPVGREESAAWNMGIPFNGGLQMMNPPTNRLTAYELSTEGKLVWELDGGNDPGELSGAYFLGAPLAVDASLFVLAEIRSAVYLLALDPKNGALQWQQQLGGLEQGITLDPQRRLTAATPSHAAGILVCPTTAGIVVAVDVIQREFAWVYRYPRQVESFANLRHGWHGRPESIGSRANNQWVEGAVVIDDGRVFLTPPESNDLHCVDLTTGKLLWKMPREKGLYLACVDRGNVLLVGSDSVTAVKAPDKSPAWSTEHVALPDGDLPSGVGYLSDGRYYLPLASGRVLAIDTQDGSTSGGIKSPPGAEVGNLICYRGSILSQSALMLDKFDQIEVLRTRAEAALAANPRDATAIRDLAEMKHLDGDVPDAIRMLKEAHTIDADDPVTREMLADCLLEALATDYASYQGDLALLRSIVYRPQQEIELLRLEAAGLEAAGEPMQAFEALLRLAASTAADPPLLQVEPGHVARSDRWIRTRLNDLWQSASAADRAALERRLAAIRGEWGSSPSVHQVRTYLAQFDGLPGTDGVRTKLVRRLLDERELLDTEIELLKLERSDDSATRAAAAVLMTEWLLVSDRVNEARQIAAAFASQFPNAPAYDGNTPQQLIEKWQYELTGDDSAALSPWARGTVTTTIEPTASPTRRDMTRRALVEFVQGQRKLRVEQLYRRPTLGRSNDFGAASRAIHAPSMYGPQLGLSQWLVSQDGSRIIGRNGLGIDTFQYSLDSDSSSRRPGNSDWVRAAQLGDLLYVTLGGQIVALDTRQMGDDEADVVWQAFPAGKFTNSQANNIVRAWSRRAAPGLYHPYSERKRPPAAAQQFVGAIGPASPDGVVLEEQRRIRCVDPISGDTLWSRSDIPSGCELFGDDQMLLAANPQASQIYAIDARDGKLISQRAMPAAPWLMTAGRNVCQILDQPSPQGARKILRIIDAVSGEELFSAEYNPTVRMTTVEPNLVAVVEAADRRTSVAPADSATSNPRRSQSSGKGPGRFELIDVCTGRRIVEQPLADVSMPRSIHILIAGEDLFLVVNGEVRPQPSRPIGLDYPLVVGQVYAFDFTSGEPLWPGPAVVDRRGISLMQPDDIPVLVFVDRVSRRDEGGGGNQLRLLCVDKATGATIYRNDALPDTSGAHFRISAKHGEPRTVTIEMSTRTVQLAYSDEPRPPQPPTNDLVEAPRKNLGRGLWGVGQRMGDMIQGAIQNPRSAGWPVPGAHAPAPNPIEDPIDDD